MNLQYLLLEDKKTTDNMKLNESLVQKANMLKTNRIKFSDKKINVGDGYYYYNALPIIPASRDLLDKPKDIFNIRVNWKRVDFGDTPVNTIAENLKLQYGFVLSIVDSDYTRNNYKNKEIVTVVFDSKAVATKHMSALNSMFLTAIEQDCIKEYKQFKKNPAKKPLTYDKLVYNAYDLYDLVDKGEL